MTLDLEENRSFRPEANNLDCLRRIFGGLLEARSDGWAITRRVGHIQLPWGSSFAFAPQGDRRGIHCLAGIRQSDSAQVHFLGTLPDASDEGDVAALLARLFVQ